MPKQDSKTRYLLWQQEKTPKQDIYYGKHKRLQGKIFTMTTGKDSKARYITVMLEKDTIANTY